MQVFSEISTREDMKLTIECALCAVQATYYAFHSVAALTPYLFVVILCGKATLIRADPPFTVSNLPPANQGLQLNSVNISFDLWLLIGGSTNHKKDITR